MRWEDALLGFNTHLKLEKSLSENSVEAYLRDIEKLKNFADNQGLKSPVSIGKADLERFSATLAEMGLQPSSQARIVSGVRAFYKYLTLEDWIAESPADFLEPPKLGRKLPVVLSPEEIDAMINTIDRSKPEGERNVALFETLYSCD